MVWYYKDGDQEKGPVSKADLQTLIKSKQVGAQTLVRSVEMDGWIPLVDVVRGKTAQPPSSPPPQPDDTLSAAPEAVETEADDDIGVLTMEEEGDDLLETPGHKDMVAAQAGDVPSTEVCSQCGRSFPKDQVIAYDDQMICAACKPMFIQRLKEGVTLPTDMRYGGFWIRVVAYFIDIIVQGIATSVIMIPASMFLMPSMVQTGDQFPAAGFSLVMGLYFFTSIAIPIFYYTFFHGRWGATVGKMACGLKVVTPEGDRITYLRAFGRYFGAMISGMILGIGFIMAGFDDEKRALHDRICSTRVIKKR